MSNRHNIKCMLWHILLSLALFTAALGAKDLSPDETKLLERRFAEAQKSTRTLRADFEQVIRLPGMPAPVVSKGEFIYRAPDDIRITFTEPPGDFLLLHGEIMEAARGGKAPVKRPSSDRSAKALVALRKVLRGSPQDTHDQMERKISRSDDEFVVSITPTVRSRELPEKIENRVDAHSLMLRTMTITLPLGGCLEFRFFRPRKDVPVDSSLFDVKP